MSKLLKPKLIRNDTIFQVHAGSWKLIISICKFLKISLMCIIINSYLISYSLSISRIALKTFVDNIMI